MTTTETLCEGVTEQEVEAIEATGWLEAAVGLKGKDGKPFHAAGFFKGPLNLYQSKDLWIVATEDYVIARLEGPVTACAEIAERILQLTEWSAVNEAAKRGVPLPDDLPDKVRDILLNGLELAPTMAVQPPRKSRPTRP